MSIRPSLLLLLFLLPSLLPCSAEAINLSNSQGISTEPRVAVDSFGQIMVVWTERSGSASQIYYAINSGNGWSTAAPVPGQSYQCNSPDLFRGPSGGFVLVYHDNSSQTIRFSDYSTAWSTPVSLSQQAGYEMGLPKVISTSNGRIFAAWQRGNPTKLEIFGRLFSGSWGDIINVSQTEGTSKYVDLYPGPSGQIYVVWQEKKGTTATQLAPFMNIEGGSGSWGGSFEVVNPSQETTADSYSHRPVVAVDGSNNLLVGYFHFQNRNYTVSLREGGAWTSPKEMGVWDTQHDLYFSDPVPLADGFVYVMRDSGFNIVYKRYSSGVWSEAAALTTNGNNSYPGADIHPRYGLTAVWADNDTGEVMFTNASLDGSLPPSTSNKPPVPSFTLSTLSGLAPFTVTYDGSASSDPDGKITRYIWSFGDGTTAEGPKGEHTYTSQGEYTLRLTVVDDKGAKASASQLIESLGLFPPLNISSQIKVNRSLFTREFIGDVTWAPNPRNDAIGANITAYRVYRRSRGVAAYKFVGTVSGATFRYLDRTGDTSQPEYEYTVTAADSQGRESSLEGLGTAETAPLTKLDRERRSYSEAD